MSDPCSAYRERLHLYFDGEVQTLEAREIEFHLTCCPPCRMSLDEIRIVERHLRAELVHFVDGDAPASPSGPLDPMSAPMPADVDPRDVHDVRDVLEVREVQVRVQIDGVSRTIDRIRLEPTPSWKRVPFDATGRNRRRNYGWGAVLVLVGAASALAVLRVSTVTTAPEPPGGGLRQAGTMAAPSLAGEDVPWAKLEEETEALLAGSAAPSDRVDRARRLRMLGARWDSLGQAGSSGETARRAYRRALDAYAGASLLDPLSAPFDSTRMRRLQSAISPPR